MLKRIWYVVLDYEGHKIREDVGNEEPNKCTIDYFEEYYGDGWVVVNVFSVLEES